MNDDTANDEAVNPEPAGADDLAWRAFRYAAGEMTADEARALEDQMATDPAACEAVVRAVQLGSELAAARPDAEVPATVTPRSLHDARYEPSHTPVAWLSIAAAVCVAFVGGIYWARRGNVAQEPIAQVPPNTATGPTTIDADAWLKLRSLEPAGSDVELAWDGCASEELPDLDVGRGPAVPTWLVDMAGATKQKGNP